MAPQSGARARRKGEKSATSNKRDTAGAKAAAGPAPWPATKSLVAIAVTSLVAISLLLTLAFRRRSAAALREPTVYSFRVVRSYDHDPGAFTQGLLFLNGTLYESTGLNGRSSVREINLRDREGKRGGYHIVRQVSLDREYFGEGLVHWRSELLQLLWRRGEGLRYSALAGPDGHLRSLPRGFRTPLKDGWGLATDGVALLATDSGADVFVLDPNSMALQRTLTVTDSGRPIEMLNELEVIDGELWANVFGQECLARISLETGAVQGWVVLTGLLDWAKARKAAQKKGREMPDVLNGIAWDAERRRLFVTGKLWPVLFEIEVVPSTEVSLEGARRRCIPQKNVFRPSSNGHEG